ncbi:hypothetical protein G5B00_01755 [Parapedobacter sp. SGR-10]|uniref:hypothetical protein n=1 Tax=Parapedobacter sp. SGR-10 TaxID=2710879 RepID=UPI0013D36E3A|nr:hypothetical protein [Parapedobacter sp. SGR-10]NGF55225.1 hypothetical protein [Parapedobacter sp. SGR-10]
MMYQLLLSVQNIEEMVSSLPLDNVSKEEIKFKLESLQADLKPDERLISYSEDELMTVKEVGIEFGVSHSKIVDMRQKGELTTIKRGSAVRLIKTEVEAAKE